MFGEHAFDTAAKPRLVPLKVIGIDPGVAITGVAVVERSPRRPTAHLVGAIRTSAHDDQGLRLASLRTALIEVLEEHRPRAAAVERLFFNANVKTAMAVGQASGVVLATLADAGVEVALYTPLEVKQSVVGVGNADKNQVTSMVTALLGLAERPKPPDAADACALAICHINRSGLARALEGARR